MSLRDQAKHLEVTAKLEGRYTEEFFNENHSKKDGRFTSGKGGSAGGSSTDSEGEKTPEQIKAEKRKALIKKIAIGAAVVAVAAGLAFTGYKLAPGSVDWGAKAKHNREMESIMDEGGEKKDKTIKDRIDRLRKNPKDERAAKDLDLLLNNRYSDPDDALGFIKHMNKKGYDQNQIDALWEYAGVHRDPGKFETEGEGAITKGAFRFNRIFRTGERTNRRDLDTINNLDRAMKTNPLPRDVKLFRGVPATKAEFDKWSKLRPGSTIIDNAPMFTGVTESRANPHYIRDSTPESAKYKAGRDHPVLFEIDAKAGLPAVSSPYGHGLASGKKVPIPPTVVIPWLKGKRKKIRIPGAAKTSMRLPWLRHLNKEEIVIRRKQPLVVTGSRIREDGVLIVSVTASP